MTDNDPRPGSPPKKRRKWLRRCIIAFSVLLAGGIGLLGCGGLYIMKLGVGQAKILLDREPIPEVLADPGVDPNIKEKLRLVLEVKEFAEKDLGLKAAKQYRYYYDTGGRPIIYTVTASPQDRLEAYTWHFPIVGEVPYKGFFALEDAVEERDELDDEGYDTNLGSAQAFSTLGWFSDPVFTSMLEQRPELVVETVIHELCHATIYVKGETPFNESLATYVGIAGAVAFLSERHGEDSREVRFARDLLADREVFSGIIQDLQKELNALYAEKVPLEEKLGRREEIFERSKARVKDSEDLRTEEFDFYGRLEMNNAIVLAILHYHTRLDHFEEVHAKEGGDLKKTIARFTAAPDEMVAGWKQQGGEGGSPQSR